VAEIVERREEEEEEEEEDEEEDEEKAYVRTGHKAEEAKEEEKHEEEIKKKDEKVAEVVRKDMKIKFKIRCAKAFLRCLNFGCSLVVLALVANSFAIFFTTRGLATKNNLPPWAPQSVLWPTYTTLAIACVSLTLAIFVLFSYWRGGHRKAEKAAVWFTAVSVFSFFFMIILWVVVASIITNAKNNSGGNDMWAWACKDNNRKDLFKDEVNYDLVCRQLDWSLVCAIIEIVVEALSILLYVAAFWRFSSKKSLRKSMHVRDQARHELYLKKLADGDDDVYRPTEHEMACKDELNLAEKGYTGQNGVYYAPPPAPMHLGIMPIIDPKTGKEIPQEIITGETSRPVTSSHAL
jgi:hypothetical protein